MNENAIQQFRTSCEVLITQLTLFLRWSNEVSSQEKVYEQKMRYIAEQNKTYGDKQVALQKKEAELIEREETTRNIELDAARKSKQAVIQESLAMKEREHLRADRHQLEKDRQLLEKEKVDQQTLKKLEKGIYEREKVVDINEKLYEEKSKRLALKEKALKDRGEYLQKMAEM